MITAVIIVVAVLVLGAVLWRVLRPPRHDAGVTSFRRHIDALSPESRREVMDRVNKKKNSEGPDGT